MNAALDEGGLSGVVVNFDDYRAIISGVVESSEEHEAALIVALDRHLLRQPITHVHLFPENFTDKVLAQII